MHAGAFSCLYDRKVAGERQGVRGESAATAALFFIYCYCCSVAAINFMRELDRLMQVAGRNNELTKCECLIEGVDFSFYLKPVTTSQLNEATKPTKKGDNPTALEQGVKLFVLRALDQNGVRKWALADIPMLMDFENALLNKLVGAMNGVEEDEDVEIADAGEPLDMKSPKKAAKD